MGLVLLMEGPDLAGKSTVTTLLSKRLGIPAYKGVGPDDINVSIKDRAVIEFNQLTNFLTQTDVDVIIDRMYLSEWVYASVFGREFDENNVKKIDEMFSKIDAINIIITANEDTLKERYDKRGDPKIDVIGIITVKDRYDQIAQKTKTPCITVETDDMKPDEVVDFLCEQLLDLHEQKHIHLSADIIHNIKKTQ